MARHHVIISGTGRAGTTFLVQLLTELGLDTGFPHARAQIYDNANAGMEYDIRNAQNAPYIVKSPGLCDYLDEALQGDDIVIDHAIVPMRDLYSAAQSRREVDSKAAPGLDVVPGGLWPRMEKGLHASINQEWILAGKLYNLMYTLAKYDIPVLLLLFPRFVNDPEYLYQKLRFLLGTISYSAFLEAFDAIRKPELIHEFRTKNENGITSEGSNAAYEHLHEQMTRQLEEKKRVEQELMAQLSEKEKALQEILNSKAWKLATAVRKARSWFPPGK